MHAFAKLLIALLAVGAYSSAYALTFPLTHNDVVGKVITFKAKHEDTFALYAREFDIGAYALERANPNVDAWIPGRGTKITIPAAFVLPSTRNGIVINLPELRLYYFDKHAGQVATYPIGIGREGWPTPLATARITAKAKDPTWTVPPSILAEHAAKGKPLTKTVAPGPDNPLGEYAFRMTLPGYLIHGTNSPIGVGRRVTHGCIRLYPVDIEALYYQVPVGTPVHIINEPIKLGWRGKSLYLEVHPMLPEHYMNSEQRKVLLVDKLQRELHGRAADINWNLVYKIMNQQTGIAQVIGNLE